MDPNVFETANAGFAQAMYEEFLRDPTAVGPEWRRLFESGVVGQRDGGAAGKRGGRKHASTPAVKPVPQPHPECSSLLPRFPAAPLPSL